MSLLDCFKQAARIFSRPSKDGGNETRATTNNSKRHLTPQTKTPSPRSTDEGKENELALRTQNLPRISIYTAAELPVETGVEVSPSPNSLSPSPSPSSRRNSESHSFRSRAESVSQQSRTRSNSKDSAIGDSWLREQLDDARIECPRNPPHSFMVPQSVLNNLLCVPTVVKDISARAPSIDTDQVFKYAEGTCRDAKQLYATLAYIKKGDTICALRDEGITDKDLPLVRNVKGGRNFTLQKQSGESINALDEWKSKHRENFHRVQWWMTAPIFELGGHKDLDENTILPFIPFQSEEKEEVKEGAYSKVYPVRVHPAHHKFWELSGLEDDEPLVAVKELFSSDETEFKKERDILETLGPKRHPHLIELLATFKLNQKYHLMFPYAKANLRKYWDDNPSPCFDEATVLWSLKQMKGIASALHLIHNFTVTDRSMALSVSGAGASQVRVVRENVRLSVREGEEMFGRHGDIKPENILWFEKASETDDARGFLKIADFGLGRFHGRDSKSNIPPNGIFSSPTYEPPECKLHQPVSRSYDIWSLGCLYLEFITWLLRGSSEINNFSEYRGRPVLNGIDDDNFFTVNPDGTTAEVRDKVIMWVEQLNGHEKCSALLKDLLDLTMKDLLVVESKQRCPSAILHEQLKMCLEKAENDKEYLLSPSPDRKRPDNDRSQSDPTSLNVPKMIKGKNVSFSDNQRLPSRSIQSQDPRDLVGRNAGTPAFNRKKGATWPTLVSA